MSSLRFDLIVIGEGIAGLACARHAAAAGLRCATFEAAVFGGLVLNVNELDPAPAGAPTNGAEFASGFVEANAELGVASLQAAVESVRRVGTGFEVVAAGDVYQAPSVVIASGASRAMLDVPGEQALSGRGVSQCADCDGPLYRGQEVVVVGGGDSALQEALALAHYCGTVHLVHRGREFRAHPRFVDRLRATPTIRPLPGHEVTHIRGEAGVTGVTLRDVDTGTQRDLACAAVFACVGLTPNTAFVPAALPRDTAGGLVAGADGATAEPGLYAIGAVRSGFGGTIADALREAEAAAAAVVARMSATD